MRTLRAARTARLNAVCTIQQWSRRRQRRLQLLQHFASCAALQLLADTHVLQRQASSRAQFLQAWKQRAAVTRSEKSFAAAAFQHHAGVLLVKGCATWRLQCRLAQEIALALQTLWRGHTARLKVVHYRARYCAARQVQRVARGHAGRLFMQRVRTEQAAAVKLQALARVSLLALALAIIQSSTDMRHTTILHVQRYDSCVLFSVLCNFQMPAHLTS